MEGHFHLTQLFTKNIYTKILVIISVLFLFYIYSLWYKSYVQKTGYGPRVVFASKRNFFTKTRGNIEGYRVVLDFRKKLNSSHPGFLVPKYSNFIQAYEGDSFISHDTVLQAQQIPIQEISKIEYKKINKDSSFALWAIQRVNSKSLIPRTSLYVLEPSEFELWWKPPNSSNYEKLDNSEELNIRIHDEVKLNGIEVTEYDDNYTIWILGYNGILYNYFVDKTTVQENGGILKKGPKILAANTPTDMRYICDLTIILGDSYNTGWQSLDAIEGEIRGLPASQKYHYFFSINAVKLEYLVIGIPKGDNDNPIITHTLPFDVNNTKIKWDEGTVVFRPISNYGSDDSLFIISADAFGASVFTRKIDLSFEKKDKSSFGLNMNTQVIDSIQVYGFDQERAYIEGVALGTNEHTDLVVSDREGIIHQYQCYHTKLFPNQPIKLSCIIRKCIPKNIFSFLKDGTFDSPIKVDLRTSVTHGQDVAYDSQGGVWIADEHYFRKIYPSLFGFWYQWALFFANQNWIPVLFIFGIVFNLYRAGSRMKTAQILIEKQNIELKKHSQIQSTFFAHISHEFRTPLNLILEPLNELREKDLKGNFLKQYNMIEQNGNRLLKLIDRLLKLSKLKVGKLSLRAGHYNLIPFLQGVEQAFELYAKHERISLRFESNEEKIMLYFDYDKLEDILYNLLANALRHTNTNGKVLIKIKCQPGNKYFPEGFVNISIKDTGCGITKERLPYIFDLYYQANEDKIGTGIGLALTKGLIQLHHGDISVKSELNWGTQFSFNLPLGKKHINKKEIIRSQNSVKNNGSGILKEVDYNEEIEPSLHPSKTDPKSEIILLIDDQPDWRNYVKENLSDQYQIIEAKDGGEGYGLAISNDPDMIICDINLPVLDGLKLCEKLKNDLRTSHIPLLLLTGRADEDDEIEGFDAGADDYITKPVKLKVLKARIRNHLSQSQNVIKTIKRTGSIDSVIKLDSPETKEFLIKFRSIIDENLSSGKYFDMTILAKKMGMSRKSLYRKFSKTIDMSPGDYAYEIRLQKVASLLLHSNETIEKIALNVGFSSGSHLAKRFRDRFGLSPNDYRDKN